MKMFCLLLACLTAAPTTLAAKENPAGQRMVDLAREQERGFLNLTMPFELNVDFTAQLNVPSHGHLTLKWQSNDHWWRKVSLAGYEGITIHNGEWKYVKRNLPFTPIRIQNVLLLLGWLTKSPDLIAGKVWKRQERGRELTCIQATSRERRTEKHELCFDADSQQLVSDSWREPLNEPWTMEFSDFFDFEGRKYPSKFDLLIDGSRVVSAELSSLSPAPFEPALLKPPKDAVARRTCPGMKPPKLIRKVYPGFQGPRPAPLGFHGETTVALTIMTDGTVGDVQIERKAGQRIDDATVAALKQWKFQPAMCGDTPVVVDINVTSYFIGW